MPSGEDLTRWTAWLALVLYAGALLLRWHAGKRHLARLAWTAGCLVFLAHVSCAFSFYHHWSHAAALADTARQTEDSLGVAWGWGIYLNYLFTLLWLADAAWWWRGLDRYDGRGRLMEWIIQAFFAFMFFNATVIFGSGPGRWLGVGVFAVLAFALARLMTMRS